MNNTTLEKWSMGAVGSLNSKVASFTFILLQVYQIDFFLRISNRLELQALRPTLLLFAIIAISLIFQKSRLGGRLDRPAVSAFNRFLLVIVLTLPLVEWPGSVIRFHIPEFIKAIVFLYFAVLVLDTEKRFKWHLGIFVTCQVFRVLEPLYLNITQGYWGGSTFLDHNEYANRLAGAPADVINPNELGFVIVTIIPFLHYLLFSGGWLKKLIYLGLTPTLLYALILTMSRGAFLALLVVGWVVWRESRHKVLLVGVAVIVATTAWAVMDDNQRDRYTSLFSSDSTQSATVDGRLDGMVNEFKLGFRRPIFGHGLGTTSEAKVHAGLGREASHNMYAEILIEVGLVGMTFFLVFIKRLYQRLSSTLSQVRILSGSNYYENLFKTFKVVFWMFALYSFNYWGLSQYYWYNLAGLVIAGSYFALKEKTDSGKK